MEITLTGLFGTTPYEWPRDDLEGVGVVSRLMGDSEGGSWKTELGVRPREGRLLRGLGHRPKAELEWLATLLRSTLRLPSLSADGDTTTGND